MDRNVYKDANRNLEAASHSRAILFLGGSGYPVPLSASDEKKFTVLRPLGEIFVVGFSKDWRWHTSRSSASLYLLPRLRPPFVRYLEMGIIGTAIALWLVARRGVRIVVAQSPYEGLAGAIVKAVARVLGVHVALVIESHGDFEESLFLHRRVGAEGIYRNLMQRVAGASIARADALRCVSESTRRQIASFAPDKPTVKFATWTDLDVYSAAGRARDAETPPEILYAGSLIPRKGAHHLVAAFATVARTMPDVRLKLAGPDENPVYAAEVRKQAAQVGGERISFLGNLDTEGLARQMCESRVFVLPTYSEGLPRVVFEAMAVGLPIVATRVSGIPEIVAEGVHGFLVEPGDEASLADRLQWILAHPMEARAMGHAAREFATRFFSTESYVAGYAKLFAVAEGSLREPS